MSMFKAESEHHIYIYQICREFNNTADFCNSIENQTETEEYDRLNILKRVMITMVMKLQLNTKD